MAKVDKSAVQIFLDHFDILFECGLILDVFFGDAHADEQCLIEWLIHAQVITDK